MSQDPDNFVRAYVIEPQDPSVTERELSYDSMLALLGGPLEVIGLRAYTDDSHTLELYVGNSQLYHPDHCFELAGTRHIGTGVVVARNENGELVNVDVSAKWAQDRVTFPHG